MNHIDKTMSHNFFYVINYFNNEHIKVIIKNIVKSHNKENNKKIKSYFFTIHLIILSLFSQINEGLPSMKLILISESISNLYFL